MGHIELLEFYGLRLMVLLTLRDFDGIYQNHRSPYEGLGVRWFIWLIIPTKEDESNNTRLSLNFLLNYTTYSRIRLKKGKDSGIKFVLYLICTIVAVCEFYDTYLWIWASKVYHKCSSHIGIVQDVSYSVLKLESWKCFISLTLRL